MTLSRSQARGFTLIEALVSLAVLSVGLLGLAALQATATDFTNNSYYRTQATIFANAYIERMRANPGGVAAGLYGPFDSSVDINCGVTPAQYCAENAAAPTTLVPPCTPSQLATVDVFSVACGSPTASGAFGGIDDQLPVSRLVVTCPGGACDSTALHRVTITWSETEQGAAVIKTVTMQVLP